MLRISWLGHVSNKEVLRRIVTTRKLIFITRKGKFLKRMMGRDGLEILTLTGHMESKRSKGKQ